MPAPKEAVITVVWEEIQRAIRTCDKCSPLSRVECTIRQQTGGPRCPVKLLVVGVAPPYSEESRRDGKVRSATNDPNDNLRKFIEKTLRLQWDELIERGFMFLHAVKCAIVPNIGGFADPPKEVVDICARLHFADEFRKVRPERVVTLGGSPLRAVIRTLEPRLPARIMLAAALKHVLGEHEAFLDGHRFAWHVTYFPRAGKRKLAAQDIQKTARKSGIIENVY